MILSFRSKKLTKHLVNGHLHCVPYSRIKQYGTRCYSLKDGDELPFPSGQIQDPFCINRQPGLE